MKIVHICLACFYIEGMQYQENVLPQKHSESGNDVYILTSDYVFDNKGKAAKREEKEYINKYNIHVKVLDKKNGYLSRFGLYQEIYSVLNRINPDIIFVHGGQFLSLKDIIFYIKKHLQVKLFIDQHGDYYNMPIDNFKRLFIQRYLFGHFIRKASKYTNMIWGVTPWRVNYLQKVYKIKPEKCDLLVMGGDDEKIDFNHQNKIRSGIRQKHNIKLNDFVVVTGGKIDKAKNIHLLMQAVSQLDNPHIKLIVFGQANEGMQPLIDNLSQSDQIRNIGWIPSDEAYQYFLASDLAVFPGTHSVLWEQACACGIPAVFKHWEGMHHVDVGGNCEFLFKDSAEEIEQLLISIINSKDKYTSMKKAAVEKGIKIFSYNEIAKRAIEVE